MKRAALWFLQYLIVGIAISAADRLPQAKTIVFLGDSITHSGQYIAFLETILIADAAKRYRILNLGLSSETVSGLSEEGHAGDKFPRPDLHERLDRVLSLTRPDLVIACYGMNCGIYKPFDEGRFKRYQDGILWLRDRCKAAGADVIHLTPPTFDPKKRTDDAAMYNAVLGAYGDWLIAQRTNGWTVIDIHGPMDAALAQMKAADPDAFLSKDGIHPGPEGHWLMTQQILKHWGVYTEYTPDDLAAPNGRLAALHALVSKHQRLLGASYLSAAGHKRPGVTPGLPLAEATAQAATLEPQIAAAIPPRAKSAPTFPGTRSDWNGYDKFDFKVDGHEALVVVPKTAAPGRPWVWHGEFFGHKPAPDIALLEKGFHIVHLRIPNMLGCPAAVAIWDGFHREMTGRYRLSNKPALVGLSRGGLYCYNWAIANPNSVSCIYADAPVCDFKSWPGGKGKGKGDAKNWALVMALWGFKNEGEALAYKGNPVDSLGPLARARIPLLHVFGDADDVVPWDENTGIVERRYRDLGGPITLIRKPGVGHHPHGLDDPTPIVEFIVRHACGVPAHRDP